MPFTAPAQGDSAEAVRLLIAHGASLKTQMWTASRAETTLLHVWAGGKGDPTIADRLGQAGCKVNTQDGDGQTPLHIAIKKWGFSYKLAPGRTNVNAIWPADYVVIDSGNAAALWLIDHKANVNAKNGDGQTPFVCTMNNRVVMFRSCNFCPALQCSGFLTTTGPKFTRSAIALRCSFAKWP